MQKTSDNGAALAAFIAHKTAIDTILARLIALSAEHFNAAPDDVTWAHAGTLGSYFERLRHVSDAAFHEGEHAG
jgi:xanthine dehydrogenase molybdopterin-binding subunit B